MTPDYHWVRVFELLLQHEHHQVTCFGRLTRLEGSEKPFDLAIVDPGRPSGAAATIQRLAHWRPTVRRILLTAAYENVSLAQEQKLPILFLPCSRRLVIAMVENQMGPAYSARNEQEEVPHGA